jgi:hypothetical protein
MFGSVTSGQYARFNPSGSGIKLDEYNSIPELLGVTTRAWMERERGRRCEKRAPESGRAELLAAVRGI